MRQKFPCGHSVYINFLLIFFNKSFTQLFRVVNKRANEDLQKDFTVLDDNTEDEIQSREMRSE